MNSTIRGILAYEGTPFLGWQKTNMGPSIQESLEKALSTILQKQTQVLAASRTDAGVHARGQVISFSLDKELDLDRLKIGVNALLPKEISLLHLETVSSSFHPTLHALEKEYHYELIQGIKSSPFLYPYTWHIPYPLDWELMEEAASLFIGTHDFSSLCNERALHSNSPICHLSHISFHQKEPLQYRICVIGNRFLYKMVRNLAGTLIYVGLKKIKPHAIEGILKHKQRSQAGVTAPAKGLFLHQVRYAL